MIDSTTGSNFVPRNEQTKQESKHSLELGVFRPVSSEIVHDLVEYTQCLFFVSRVAIINTFTHNKWTLVSN